MPNLSTLKWMHAVNDQGKLNIALEGPFDMIEADIVFGQLNESGSILPIMAHPPAKTSNLTLWDFLQQIKKHNATHSHNGVIGIKLDFKSIEAFEQSLSILNDEIPQMHYPIWLNADIIKGPIDQNQIIPLDPERFLSGCCKFPKAVLSVGWTTYWSTDSSDIGYTKEEIDSMYTVLKDNNITTTGQCITFPVRAGIAANSLDQLKDLITKINETNETTLTIWSSSNDYVNVPKLKKFISSFGSNRIYIDVPEELNKQLHEINLTSDFN